MAVVETPHRVKSAPSMNRLGLKKKKRKKKKKHLETLEKSFTLTRKQGRRRRALEMSVACLRLRS